MTRVKSPSVRILMGSVRMNIIGLIKAFTSPKTTETMTAVRKLFISIPGRIEAVTKTPILFRIIATRIPTKCIIFPCLRFSYQTRV